MAKKAVNQARKSDNFLDYLINKREAACVPRLGVCGGIGIYTDHKCCGRHHCVIAGVIRGIVFVRRCY